MSPRVLLNLIIFSLGTAWGRAPPLSVQLPSRGPVACLSTPRSAFWHKWGTEH